MTEEQKEAIKRLKMHKDFASMDNGCCIVNVKDVEIVLTMLEENDETLDLDEEITKYFKNKVIRKM